MGYMYPKKLQFAAFGQFVLVQQKKQGTKVREKRVQTHHVEIFRYALTMGFTCDESKRIADPGAELGL